MFVFKIIKITLITKKKMNDKKFYFLIANIFINHCLMFRKCLNKQ